MTRLEPGEHYTTPDLAASDKFADTGLSVEGGEEYRISVEIIAPLKDKSIPVADTTGFSSAELEGWQKRLMTYFEKWRRAPHRNWFYLLGCIDKPGAQQLEIGSGGDFSAPRAGTLFVYLNDHPLFYFNNKGSYRLEIRRLG